jgi:hypothetical protein
MKWFALVFQILITLGVSVGVIATFGYFIYFLVGAIGMFALSMSFVARELSAAGGELPSFRRVVEGIAIAMLIGLVWPLLPIAFAWSDIREQAEDDDP